MVGFIVLLSVSWAWRAPCAVPAAGTSEPRSDIDEIGLDHAHVGGVVAMRSSGRQIDPVQLAQSVFIELDAEAGTGGDLHRPVADLDRAWLDDVVGAVPGVMRVARIVDAGHRRRN